jgi:hypothetical protein
MNSERIAICPTGPQPHTATVSPGFTSQNSAPIQPVGRMSERKSTVSSGRLWGILMGPKSA